MFNVRDLMVNLAAHAGRAAQPQLVVGVFCRICTGTCCDTGHSVICFAAYSGGGCGCTMISPIELAASPVDPATAGQQLSVLKEQLKSALADIEKQESAQQK
jgi:hypothetical protein